VSLLKKSNSISSSRRQINISGVNDGVLILPSFKYRSILQVSSINFELKSEAEQDVVIDTYQSFLNSLAIPLQIVIRIREMDMDRYLDDFTARMKKEEDHIYKEQVCNYTEFISSLVSKNKILSRHFYVVLPYDGNEKNIDIVTEQLALNADIVTKGLARLGIQTKVLDSIEILDLFYGFYSSKQAKRQPLKKQTLQLLKEMYI
jgi:hypothetical protein